MSDAVQLRLKMAAELVSHGEVTSPAWRRAVEAVPRHLLVPHFYEQVESGRRHLIDSTRPDEHDRWLVATYDRTKSLVTEYDPVTGYATSSATMPSIVLPMLEALDVHPGHRVLDVGTGSGYSTALLCERAGEANVTSIDVGAKVVQAAQEGLARAGYAPLVVCNDGFNGYPPNAPYDRLVSMVTVPRIPSAWVEQLQPGGIIVGTLPWATFRLCRQGDGSASGRFLAGFTFMWMQGHAPRRVRDDSLAALVCSGGEMRDSPRLATMWYGSEIPVFWTLARLVLWPFGVTVDVDNDKAGLIDVSDHSWVLIDLARNSVTQGGARKLWDDTEKLYMQLEDLGRPGRDRLGLKVRPKGSQYVWLDDPDGDHRWELE